MATENFTKVKCDRCSASVTVEAPRWGNDLTETLEKASAGGPKWRKVEGGRILCPDCHPPYEAMKAKHGREVAEFFGEVVLEQ